MDVVFGRGLDRIAAWLRDAGARKVAILAPPSRRFVAELAAALADFAPTVFDGAKVHVPVEVVDAAVAHLASAGTDTVVAIGGGSPIGLGKALKLRREVRFVAVPTTYAGSEMTTMFGITTGATKQTGRDPRVRPDLVVYDVELTHDLPLTLTLQSLYNALAHVISALSTDSLEGETRAAGLQSAATVMRAIDALVVDPASLEARELAQRGASGCAAAYDQGKPGVQHKLAHVLGGALGLDHARIHAALLPEFLAHLWRGQEVLVDEIEQAIGHPCLDRYLRDLLRDHGVPTTLGATVAQVKAAFADRPELPVHLAVHVADDYL